jgi:hypothetical protein
MSLQPCSVCSEPPAFKCLCNDTLYCKSHLGIHLYETRNHHPIKIKNILTENSFRQLEAEVSQRINAINELKKNLIAQATELISRISQFVQDQLEELERQTLVLIILTKENSFDDLMVEEARKVVNSILEFSIEQKKIEKIEELFNMVYVKEVPKKIETIMVDSAALSIIQKYSLHIEIMKKYPISLIKIIDNNKVQLICLPADLEKLKNEITSLSIKYTFFPDGRWSILDDDGIYRSYDEHINTFLEALYYENYIDINNPNYDNYSIGCQVTIRGTLLTIEFATNGLPHRMKRDRFSSKVRPVKRITEYIGLFDIKREFDFQWLWENSEGQLIQHEPEANWMIEQSFIELCKGDRNDRITVVLGSDSRVYLVDLKKMKQCYEIEYRLFDIKRIPPANLINI